MTAPSGRNTPKPDPTQAKCVEVLDKLLALSNGGPSGELSLTAAAQLASDLAGELAAFDVTVRARHAAR
jgi:hypothetical protein